MLILNIMVVLFFILNKPPATAHHPPHKMGPPPMLNLSESQTEAFHGLADQHKADMRRIMEQQRTVLKTYFEPLYNNGIENDKSVLSTFFDLEQQKINSTYTHFQDVKQLLNKDQLKHYPEFVEKTLGLIHGGRRGPHPPPR